MLNEFLTGVCSETVLPALPTDPDCLVAPPLSQVVGIIVLPKGAAGPASWTVLANWATAIDNTDTVNANAKYVAGRGEIDEPEEVTITEGKRTRTIATRLYTLNFEFPIQDDGQYSLIQTIQKQYWTFRFWAFTLGERLYGGQTGIRPHFATATAPKLGGAGDHEIGRLQIEWFADGEPPRTNIGDLEASL